MARVLNASIRVLQALKDGIERSSYVDVRSLVKRDVNRSWLHTTYQPRRLWGYVHLEPRT